VDDYKKLARVMQYLLTTRDLALTLEPCKHLNWWVDSSYVVHPDMHSQSGIVMSFGKGAAYLTSCKQKLNTKSSTEAELVAIDDVLGQILWTHHFLNGQGIVTPDATNIHQDNKSMILLTERYFFVTHKIKKGKVKVSFCPTHEILADFFTKPLQGTQFLHMQSKILNLPSTTSTAAHRSVLGKSKKA